MSRLQNLITKDNLTAIFFIGCLVVSLTTGIALYSYHQALTLPTLANIKEEGVLRVVTRNSPTTYYEEKHGPAGFEYELTNLFAEDLGVHLHIIQADNFSEMFSYLNRHRAVLAAAGLTITAQYQKHLSFSSPYREVTQQIIYNRNNTRPTTVEELVGKMVVPYNSSESTSLDQLQIKKPSLNWEESYHKDLIDLLNGVTQNEFDYTVVNSNEFAVNAGIFPELGVAFSIGKPQLVAWAFPKNADPALITAANTFFEKIKRDGRLKELEEKYFGHIHQIDYVGAEKLFEDSRKKLPRYLNAIKASAEKYGFEWQMIAALAYQESHWTPDAVSPTGVRGFMMLTKETAAYLGVTDQFNAQQSIEAGTRYLAEIRDGLPSSIEEPDRTWLALAAYNVGIGHLEDARKLTQQLRKDPNKWVDVKQHLPLLQKPQWFTQTRHGYARGYEPVLFVQNIRRYMDIINWATNIREDYLGLDDLSKNSSPKNSHLL